MHGLKQIQVITQGDAWHLVGLDDQGQVWFGATRRTTKRRAITWVLVDEAVEEEPPPTPGTPPSGEGPAPPRWPSRAGA